MSLKSDYDLCGGWYKFNNFLALSYVVAENSMSYVRCILFIHVILALSDVTYLLFTMIDIQ